VLEVEDEVELQEARVVARVTEAAYIFVVIAYQGNSGHNLHNQRMETLHGQ
jgi:hypothetical protein